MNFMPFFTPDHIFELILASGLIATNLPPVNEALDRAFGNKYVKKAFQIVDDLRDGVDEEEAVNGFRAIYRRLRN